MLMTKPDSTIYELEKASKRGSIAAQSLGYFVSVFYNWEIVDRIHHIFVSSQKGLINGNL